MYTISEFGKLIGKSVVTLQRWDREGRLIAKRTPTNRRYYTEEQLLEYRGIVSTDTSKTVAYIRVSGASQKNDLKSQKEYISQFMLNRGQEIDEWVEDIGSGLNFKRKGFNQLMLNIEHGQVKVLVIAHKDRLVRFGYDWFEQFCTNHGCKILIINNDKLSPQQEIVQDLISIIHVFSCRVYGLRSYQKKVQEDKHLLEDENI